MRNYISEEKKKKVPDVIHITLWQYFAKWTSLFTEA